MPLYFVVPSREPNSKYSSKPQGPIIEDKAEYIRQLTALLESKDFRERIKGLDQLVADCQHNPSMVIRSLFPVRKTPPPLVTPTTSHTPLSPLLVGLPPVPFLFTCSPFLPAPPGV